MEKFVELKNIVFEKAAIATLTVNRPPALNALNREVLEEMARVIREVRHDSSVRVLIVTGAGDRAFVAGAVIAAVNGFALGGGLELALACDLIIASEKARFGQPEINLGLIPGFGGTQRLPHRIGHAHARELIMTGEMFDAKIALDWGLANQVVAPGELIESSRKLAEKLASKSAIALRQAKAALRAAFTMNEDAGLRFEQEAFGVVFGSADRVEGTAAFVEKRPPAWQHK